MLLGIVLDSSRFCTPAKQAAVVADRRVFAAWAKALALSLFEMIEDAPPAADDQQGGSCNKGEWPGRDRNITIQQDGAPAHIDEDDAVFVAAATDGLWNIKLQTQPPKSPDLNLLDLSFFCALQSHQWRSGFENNINELVAQVQLAFATFE